MLCQPQVENILRDPEKKGQPCPRVLTRGLVDHHRWRLPLDRVNISILMGCGVEVKTALRVSSGLGCRGRPEKGRARRVRARPAEAQVQGREAVQSGNWEH